MGDCWNLSYRAWSASFAQANALGLVDRLGFFFRFSVLDLHSTRFRELAGFNGVAGIFLYSVLDHCERVARRCVCREVRMPSAAQCRAELGVEFRHRPGQNIQRADAGIIAVAADGLCGKRRRQKNAWQSRAGGHAQNRLGERMNFTASKLFSRRSGTSCRPGLCFRRLRELLSAHAPQPPSSFDADHSWSAVTKSISPRTERGSAFRRLRNAVA